MVHRVLVFLGACCVLAGCVGEPPSVVETDSGGDVDAGDVVDAEIDPFDSGTADDAGATDDAAVTLLSSPVPDPGFVVTDLQFLAWFEGQDAGTDRASGTVLDELSARDLSAGLVIEQEVIGVRDEQLVMGVLEAVDAAKAMTVALEFTPESTGAVFRWRRDPEVEPQSPFLSFEMEQADLMRVGLRSPSTAGARFCDVSVRPDARNHVVFAVSEGNLRVYVNGAFACAKLTDYGRDANANLTDFAPTVLSFGRPADFSGTINSLAIWARELTPYEVAQAFRATRVDRTGQPVQIPETTEFVVRAVGGTTFPIDDDSPVLRVTTEAETTPPSGAEASINASSRVFASWGIDTSWSHAIVGIEAVSPPQEFQGVVSLMLRGWEPSEVTWELARTAEPWATPGTGAEERAELGNIERAGDHFFDIPQTSDPDLPPTLLISRGDVPELFTVRTQSTESGWSMPPKLILFEPAPATPDEPIAPSPSITATDTLEWMPVPGADHYEVYTNSDAALFARTRSTSVDISEAEPQIYRVVAVDPHGLRSEIGSTP